jgi:hypothetical protein
MLWRRTATLPSTGDLKMLVNTVVFRRRTCFGEPTFTESTRIIAEAAFSE